MSLKLMLKFMFTRKLAEQTKNVIYCRTLCIYTVLVFDTFIGIGDFKFGNLKSHLKRKQGAACISQ